MTIEEIKQYEDKIRSIALNGKFIEAIVLHDAEYYNALNDCHFGYYNKIHSNGDIKYSGSLIPFFKGKKIGVYTSDIYEKLWWLDDTKQYTTEDIVDNILTNLERRHGKGHVSKTDKQGTLFIDPYIEVIIRKRDNNDRIILSYDDYRTAHEKYIEITDKFNEVNILYDK